MRKKWGKFLFIMGIICSIVIVIEWMIFNVTAMQINNNPSFSHNIYGSQVDFWEWLSETWNYIILLLPCITTIVLSTIALTYDDDVEILSSNNSKLKNSIKSFNNEITKLKSENFRLQFKINDLEETISKKSNRKKDV